MKVLLARLLLPAAMILVPIAMIFGSASLDSLQLALKNPVISGQATNLGWMLVHFLGVGPTPEDGRVLMIWCRAGECMILMKLIKASFFLTYGLILVQFLRRRDKTFDDCLA